MLLGSLLGVVHSTLIKLIPFPFGFGAFVIHPESGQILFQSSTSNDAAAARVLRGIADHLDTRAKSAEGAQPYVGPNDGIG